MTDDAIARTGVLSALAALDGLTHGQLGSLLSHHPPAEALAVICGEAMAHAVIAPLLASSRRAEWRRALERKPAAQWAEENRHQGVRAVCAADADYPPMLRCDPRPPPVLFLRGDLDALDHRRVAVVGTRNATRHGRETAAQLGFDLSAAGVAVVSGLAKGIDAAAHHGAHRCNEARPIGVVGNGLDRPYPAVNARLWAEVGGRGLMLSEWPIGTTPDAFRFPMRNRIIAALAEVVVVVESREKGGSLITAVEAGERDVRVMAVPGSVRNRASTGTNRLLADGADPVTDASDVLLALGLDTRRSPRLEFDPRPAPRGLESTVLERCRLEPATLDDLVVALALPVGEVAMALARLERAGWVREATGWFEAVGSWSRLA